MSEEMKRDIQELKAASFELRASTSELKASTSELKAVVSAMSTEMRAGFDRLEGMMRRMAVHVSTLTGDVADLKQSVALIPPMQKDISLMKSAIQAFIPEVEASRGERVIARDFAMAQQRRLDDHEKRISRLEKPKS